MDREEMKKKEKEQRKRREEEDDPSRLIWIKYPLGLKHQVFFLFEALHQNRLN